METEPHVAPPPGNERRTPPGRDSLSQLQRPENLENSLPCPRHAVSPLSGGLCAAPFCSSSSRDFASSRNPRQSRWQPRSGEYAIISISIPTTPPLSAAIGMAGIPAADAVRPPDTMGVVTPADNQPGDLRCCCGKEDCVFLKHNCSVLSSVERDVHTAARMGQVSSRAPHSFSDTLSFDRAARILCATPAF
jgi:hypothetical protein